MELSRRSFFACRIRNQHGLSESQPSPALAVESSSEWKLVNTRRVHEHRRYRSACLLGT